MAENVLMAKAKDKTDRHKPHRMVRVRERIAKQVEALAQTLEKDLTQMANDLLIEALQARGLWPPKGKAP